MNIFGQKILLRAMETEDAELLRTMINDGDMEYLLGGWSFPVSQMQQRQWMEQATARADQFRAMIEADGKTVGTVMLTDLDYKNGTAQIHIKLCRGCRGQGYGTDAVRTVTEYAFRELRLHCVYAQISQHNVASQKLFEKCGYRQEGVLRDRLFKRGAYVSVLVFSAVSRPDGTYD